MFDSERSIGRSGISVELETKVQSAWQIGFI